MVVPSVAPMLRSASSSLKRKLPLPPPPPVHVQVGLAFEVGVVPKTEGGLGMELSMTIVKDPVADHRPARFLSST